MARKIWMTPTPSESARDTTNAIHQIALRMAKHLPEFGYEIIENPDQADLRVTHAGQGSIGGDVDVAIYHGLYPTAQGMDGIYFAINSHVIHNLKVAKHIIAPSNWIADVIRRDMHVDPHIVSWGVDVDEWLPGDNPHVYALWNKARVDKVSDPAPMLELAARAKNVPFLTTFGQGGSNVKTIGRQPYEVMKNHIRNAGVYLSLNVETFGLGILEACAAGVPVLGFRQGAIAEYLTHGVNAFLAEPGDMEGLYNGLAYCLKHRAALGANARALAQQFSWSETARKMALVFDAALQPRPQTKVSVIIPCHDYGWCVGEAIESALKQEANFEYEIIVVLDRCTDNSAEIVAGYANRGVIALTVNNGSLSQTRNDGIGRAAGEFIVLLDADDRLGNVAFLQTLSDSLDRDRTIGIAFTGITIMNEAGERGHLNAWPKGYNFDLQAQRKNQVPSCCMFRKEAWKRAGGFRPHFKYAEDAEFWLTVGSLGYGGKQVVNDGWFEYRIHDKSASRVHRTGEIKEPDWTEFHPWTKDGQRPFASDGKAPNGSWPVRFYHQPSVSIIIPVGKGHEEKVKDALHSVEGQTYRLWECIVVLDDVQADLSGFPWAKVISTHKRLGAGAARNLGANKANSQLLVFLDADDILKPGFIAESLKAYQQSGRYIYTDWLTDDRRGIVEIHTTPDYTYAALRENPSLHLVTALIPRKWFIAVGGFDEKLTAFEDVDLFMKLYAHGYCGQRVSKPLVMYNLDAGYRRKTGDPQKDKFKSLLQKRYGKYMEVDHMCDCVDPPNGLKPVAPTLENAAAYHETYGAMVKVQYISQFAPEAPATLRGPATRVHYGQRAKGEIFHIWEADLTNSQDMFVPVAVVADVPEFVIEPEQTIVPPAPTSGFDMAFMEAADKAFIESVREDDPSLADTEPAEPVSITEELQSATWDTEGDGRAKRMVESLDKPAVKKTAPKRKPAATKRRKTS